MPRTADILLRDSASPPQRHEEPLETREYPAEPSSSLPIEPSTHKEYRSTSALQSSIPTLPPAPTDPPVQLIVKGSEKSTLTPASLVQRKATVKAAQIRRKTTPIMESGSMVVAPIQRLVSTTARVAHPIPGSLPLPSSSIETDEVKGRLQRKSYCCYSEWQHGNPCCNRYSNGMPRRTHNTSAYLHSVYIHPFTATVHANDNRRKSRTVHTTRTC